MFCSKVTAPCSVTSPAADNVAVFSEVVPVTVRNSSALVPLTVLANTALPLMVSDSWPALVASTVPLKVTVPAVSDTSAASTVGSLNVKLVAVAVIAPASLTCTKSLSLKLPASVKVTLPMVRFPVPVPSMLTLPPLAVVVLAPSAKVTFLVLSISSTSPAAPLSRSSAPCNVVVPVPAVCCNRPAVTVA